MVWWGVWVPGKRLGIKSGGMHLRCQKCKVCLVNKCKLLAYRCECPASYHHKRGVMCLECLNQ